MTVKELLKLTAGQVQPSEADALLAHLLGRDKIYIYAHPETRVKKNLQQRFLKLIKARARQPLAYLLGRQAFYGRDFQVSPAVLIPRPDSEVMIDAAKKFLSYKKTATIIDVGTGSGCLIITVALETANKFTYLGLDISQKALAVARQNAKILGAKITLKRSSLLSGLQATGHRPLANLIIANLPYLTPKQLKEPSIQAEPRLALAGGADGLLYYRRLLTQVPAVLKPGGRLMIEIDPQQKTAVTRLLRKDLPTWHWQFKKDLAGRYRLVIINKSSP